VHSTLEISASLKTPEPIYKHKLTTNDLFRQAYDTVWMHLYIYLNIKEVISRTIIYYSENVQFYPIINLNYFFPTWFTIIYLILLCLRRRSFAYDYIILCIVNTIIHIMFCTYESFYNVLWIFIMLIYSIFKLSISVCTFILYIIVFLVGIFFIVF